jgi:DNA polymerase III epsilon subunit-like protein
LIDPEIPIPPEVSQIHGITDDMVVGAPKCSQVVPEFLDWIGDARTVLIAHNAPFDIDFLHIAMARLRRQRPANSVVDTLPFARSVLSDAPNHQLKTLVEHLGLSAGDYHRALADSHHVRNVFSHLISSSGVSTWSDLCAFACVLPFDQDLYSFEPPPELLSSITSINEAIAAGSSLSFVYSGYRSFRRTVDPVALIQSRGTYYLTAYCKKASAERTFRLDRISQLKPVEGQSRHVRTAEAAS